MNGLSGREARTGDTIPEDIRGKRTSVHYYEVVIHDGDIERTKAARVSVLAGSSDAIEAGLDKTRGQTLPKVRVRSLRRCRRSHAGW